MKNNSIESANGRLFIKMGRGKYNNPDSPEKVIKYILRSEGSSKAGQNDVIYHSSYGATNLDIDMAIYQFKQIADLNTRKTKTRRYIDHEVFSFSHHIEKKLKYHPELIPEICSQMAKIISDEKYQVIYALHAPDKEEQYLHLHFATNTVSFVDALKRQENFRKKVEHEQALNEYLEKMFYPHNKTQSNLSKYKS